MRNSRKILSLIFALVLSLLGFSCSQTENTEVRIEITVLSPPANTQVFVSGIGTISSASNLYTAVLPVAKKTIISVGSEGYNTKTIVIEKEDFVDRVYAKTVELVPESIASVTIEVLNANTQSVSISGAENGFVFQDGLFRSNLQKDRDYNLEIACEGYETRILSIVADKLKDGYASFSVILAKTGNALLELELPRAITSTVPRATVLETHTRLSLFYQGANELNYLFYFEAPINKAVQLYFYVFEDRIDKSMIYTPNTVYPDKIYFNSADIKAVCSEYILCYAMPEHEYSTFFYSINGKRYRAEYLNNYSLNEDGFVYFYAPKGAYVLEAYYNEDTFIPSGLDTFGRIAVRYMNEPLSSAHAKTPLEKDMFSDWELYSNNVKAYDVYEKKYIDSFSLNQELFIAVNYDTIKRIELLETSNGIIENASAFCLKAESNYLVCKGSGERTVNILLYEKNIASNGRKGEDSFIELRAMPKINIDYTVVDVLGEELKPLNDNEPSGGNYYYEENIEAYESTYYQGGETVSVSYIVKTLTRTFYGWGTRTASVDAYFFIDEIDLNESYNYEIYHNSALEYEIMPYNADTGDPMFFNVGGYIDYISIYLSNIKGAAQSIGNGKILFMPGTTCDIHYSVERYNLLVADGKPTFINLYAESVTFDYSMDHGTLRIYFKLL